LLLTINVGIGAADPERQLQKFKTGAEIVGQIFGEGAAPLLEFKEINKEIWGNLGYRDGSRFLKMDAPDPMVTKLREELEALQKKLDRKELENQTKVEVGRMQALSRILTQVVENMGNLEEGQQEFGFDQLRQVAGMIEMVTQEQMRAQASEQGRGEDHARALDVESLRGMLQLQNTKAAAKARPAPNGG
jgi:hypothetical protein